MSCYQPNDLQALPCDAEGIRYHLLQFPIIHADHSNIAKIYEYEKEDPKNECHELEELLDGVSNGKTTDST